ncbi:hypothetical protein A6R68_22859 [Neotoma lepida]|uniref:Uncharacterized protein n=1 Tax=Neotoma lepida TaxID=56216 RepID=A0A1A6HY43_NEOLE|nr:hypothetical protein A6R68_22859 [Neotoma lepida]
MLPPAGVQRLCAPLAAGSRIPSILYGPGFGSVLPKFLGMCNKQTGNLVFLGVNNAGKTMLVHMLTDDRHGPMSQCYIPLQKNSLFLA